MTPATNTSPPQRILILKPSALGDVITALPVLRGLRRACPAAQIDWLLATPYIPLLEHDTDLHACVPFERKKLGRAWRSPAALSALLAFRKSLRAERYDWVLDLQGLARSAIFARWTRATTRAGFADAREGAPLGYTHRVKTQAQPPVDRNIAIAADLGVEGSRADMTRQIEPNARTAVEKLLQTHRLGEAATPFLAAVPPTRWVTKQYPARHWRSVVATLAKDLPVVLIGSRDPAERALCAEIAANQPGPVIDLAGQTSIPQLVALLAQARGVICSDSAAKFIAPAVGTPCVTLLGPTRVERTGPIDPDPSRQISPSVAIVADVPCQGCLKKRCPHITCMQSIAPEQIIDAARHALRIEVSPCP
jgi:heptosyltransferase-1